MVAVSAIVGATFAVGGGYLLVGALRALLIGGSFSQYTLKRVGVAAGTFGVGAYLIHRAASQAAAATASAATKAQIVKTIQGAAEGSVDSYGGNLGITINGDWALGDHSQDPCAINIKLDPYQSHMMQDMTGVSTNTTGGWFTEIVEDGRDPKEVIDEYIAGWAGDNWRQEIKDGTSGYAAEESTTVYKIESEVQDIGNWGDGGSLDWVTSHNSWRTKEGAIKAMREMADQEVEQWAYSIGENYDDEFKFSFVEDNPDGLCLILSIDYYNPDYLVWGDLTQDDFKTKYTMLGNKGDRDYDGMTYSMCVRESSLMDAEGPTVCHPCRGGTKNAESFEAPMGYDPEGPRPFYGNPRKLIYDRWGNRRFLRRRKDGTYMDNVDVVRSIRMDRQRKAKTWAPGGFRDQGDGSMELLANLLGAESFKDWADEEDEEHGDISFDKWIREEMEEPTHESNPPDSLTFLKWARKEGKGHTFAAASNKVEDPTYDQSYSIVWSE